MIIKPIPADNPFYGTPACSNGCSYPIRTFILPEENMSYTTHFLALQTPGLLWQRQDDTLLGFTTCDSEKCVANTITLVQQWYDQNIR